MDPDFASSILLLVLSILGGYAVRHPDSFLGQSLGIWFGPKQHHGELRSDYYVRLSKYCFNWLLFLALLSVILYYFAPEQPIDVNEHFVFYIVSFSCFFAALMALFGGLGCLVKAFCLRIFNRDSKLAE